MDEETKTIVKSLVASTPLRSTIRTLLKDYRDTEGQELPYRQLGFDNPEQYLRSIPDAVQINGCGPNAEVLQVHSNKLDHINALVSKQRVPKGRKSVRRSRITATVSPHDSLFSYISSNRRSPPNVERHNQQQPSRNLYINKMLRQHNALTSPPRSRVTAAELSKPPEPQRSPRTGAAASGGPETVRYLNISPYVKKYMLHCIEDGDETFYEDRVPTEVKNNLRNLIGDYPEGIWCSDLPRLYMSRYLTNLDCGAYKFRTLTEMCLYLASIFQTTRPNKGDFKLYDKRKPILLDLSVDGVQREEDNSTVIANDLGIPDIEKLAVSCEPPDVMQFLDDIPRQWLSKEQVEGSYIDVSVAEIYDPSKYWFIVHKDKLDAMMDDMQMYYGKEKNSLQIPPKKLKEGLYCCVVFLSEYHRAVVIATSATSNEDRVKVYLIDYGTVIRVPAKRICYLHKKFATLPQQAIRGRLAGIYPICAQQQWPREISSRFFDLVLQKELVGRIVKINLEKQLVHLVLIEPKGSKERDIYVNQLLIDEGYAVALPEEQKQMEVNKYAVPIVRHLHFYPSFEELEQGLVPSAPEMINLLKKGCSLESIYPQYFHRHSYKEELQNLRSKEVSPRNESSLPSSANTECAEAKSSDSVPDKVVNFTQASIQDKGGTMEGAGREAQAAATEGCPLVGPPPGFEDVPQPPNYGYYATSIFQPIIQQNYFLNSFPRYYVPPMTCANYTVLVPHQPMHYYLPPSPSPQVSQYLKKIDSVVVGTRTSEVIATCATSQTNRKDVACSIASKELVQKTGTECDECKAEDDNVCLLDMDEVELESVLSRNGTQMDKGFIDISALEFFLTDTEEPEKNSTCNRHVTMKAVGGKTTAVVKWEEKEYVVFDEIIRLYVGRKLELSKVKLLLTRRNIFVRDINVDLLEEDSRDEFQRNNLVTNSRFGRFVHLIELQQLSSFVSTFVPELEVLGADVLS